MDHDTEADQIGIVTDHPTPAHPPVAAPRAQEGPLAWQ